MLKNLLLTAALSTAFVGTALAADVKAGDLTIMNPVARATPPSAKVGAGFMMIKNTGETDDVLLSGKADFAGKVEIHEGKMENGVMTMRELVEGITIPAGGSATLKPGGNHVMFMKLAEGMKEGEKRETTLTFKNAGDVKVIFDVKSIAQTMKMKHN